MVSLLQDSNEKICKMPSRAADRRQVASATYYCHFKRINKGGKNGYILQHQILKNKYNIYRNKCTAVSVKIYWGMFLSSSSSYSLCYEESTNSWRVPTKDMLFPFNPRGEHVTQNYQNYNTHPSHSDQFRDGHVTQAWPIRDFSATAIKKNFLWELIGE